VRIFFISPYPEAPGKNGGPSRAQVQARSYASPGTEIDFGACDDFAGGQVSVKLHNQASLNGLHHAMSMTSLLQKVKWCEEQGYDAVIQSNTFDPGVEEMRLAVNIPVIPTFRTTLHVATMIADRIGITVPFEGHVGYTWKILRSYGMEHFVKAIYPIGMYPGTMKSEQELRDTMVDVLQTLVRDHKPEAIIPLGGALAPNIVDPKDLEEQCGVPVLNTKSIAIRIAEMCVNLGLAQSPIAYPHGKLSYEDFFQPAHGS